MLGIASLASGQDGEVAWFAQAVAAAARGRQMETLWRAHINLATALHREGRSPSEGARDHAAAALEIMEADARALPAARTDQHALRLSACRSRRRFGSSFSPVTKKGFRALERYPRLRLSFSDPAAGVLASEDTAPRSHEWLRISGEDYVIY